MKKPTIVKAHYVSAEVLDKHGDEILDALVNDGMSEVNFRPYTYAVPLTTKFDCLPDGADNALLVTILAERHNSTAKILGGEVALDYYREHGKKWQLVEIFDPFAQKIDEKVNAYQRRMVAEGKARVVNGHFFKVA